MQLSKELLNTIGGFTPNEPAKRTVDVTLDGKEHTFDVFVKRKKCSTIDDDHEAYRNGKRPASYKISTTICNEDGQPVFTYDEAGELAPELATALLLVITEVNEPSPKKSPPKKKSGSN